MNEHQSYELQALDRAGEGEERLFPGGADRGTVVPVIEVRLQWPREAPMTTVSTRILKDQLSSYLQRAERGERIVVLRDGHPVAALIPLSQLQGGTEQQRLAELESRGLVTLPKRTERKGFRGPVFPSRGKLASEMVSEDRR